MTPTARAAASEAGAQQVAMGAPRRSVSRRRAVALAAAAPPRLYFGPTAERGPGRRRRPRDLPLPANVTKAGRLSLNLHGWRSRRAAAAILLPPALACLAVAAPPTTSDGEHMYPQMTLAVAGVGRGVSCPARPPRPRFTIGAKPRLQPRPTRLSPSRRRPVSPSAVDASASTMRVITVLAGPDQPRLDDAASSTAAKTVACRSGGAPTRRPRPQSSATLAVAALAPSVDQQSPTAVSTPEWRSHPGASHRVKRPRAVLPTPNARQDPYPTSPPSPVSPSPSSAAGSVT